VEGGGGGEGCAGLTTLPPSCPDCLEIWEPQPPGTLWACNAPVQGLLYLHLMQWIKIWVSSKSELPVIMIVAQGPVAWMVGWTVNWKARGRSDCSRTGGTNFLFFGGTGTDHEQRNLGQVCLRAEVWNWYALNKLQNKYLPLYHVIWCRRTEFALIKLSDRLSTSLKIVINIYSTSIKVVCQWHLVLYWAGTCSCVIFFQYCTLFILPIGTEFVKLYEYRRGQELNFRGPYPTPRPLIW